MRVVVSAGLSSVVIVAGVVAGMQFLGSATPEALPPPAPAVPVVEASVQQRDMPIILTGLGTVHALNTATIRSQVTGLLQTVNFTEGQAVHRGDVLAQVDPRPNQAQLDQAEAQLGRDQAQLADAQINLNRNVPLLSGGLPPTNK